MNKQIKFITTIGLLMALTIVFQVSSKVMPLGEFGNFITGSLVNMCLIISVSVTGILGGSIIGILTPFIALLTGSPVPLVFIPLVSLCNFSLILSFSLLKTRKVVNIVIPAIIKTSLLYLSINIIISLMRFAPKKAKMLLYLFGWPQFITAIIGGIIATIVLNRLKNHVSLSL